MRLLKYGMGNVMPRRSKQPAQFEKKPIITQLRKQHELAYLKTTPKELKAIKNYRNWLKNPEREISKVIRGLEKKIVHVKTPINQSVIQKTVFDLIEVSKRLASISASFCKNMDLNKDYLDKLLAMQKPNDHTSMLSLNHILALMCKIEGGPIQLKKAFELNPWIVPIGIKHDITSEAIRLRIRKIKNL